MMRKSPKFSPKDMERAVRMVFDAKDQYPSQWAAIESIGEMRAWPLLDPTPQRMSTALTAEQLAQEKLRLRVQLRLKINDLRRAHVSEYLLDDVVLRHKGRLAEAVVKAGGALPPGTEGTPLISHAAARGQTLVDAARDVLTEMSDVAAALLETEQMKDATLSRIASVTTFLEIEVASRVIERLAFKTRAAG
jgi:hypothetical protein